MDQTLHQETGAARGAEHGVCADEETLAALYRVSSEDELIDAAAAALYAHAQPPTALHAAWLYPAGPWHQSE